MYKWSIDKALSVHIVEKRTLREPLIDEGDVKDVNRGMIGEMFE